MYSCVISFITFPFYTGIRTYKLTSRGRAEATIDTRGKKDKILLKIGIDPTALKGVDMDDIKETLKGIGRQKGKKRLIKVKADIFPLS